MNPKVIKIDFKPRRYGDNPYTGRHLEIRIHGSRSYFYECITGTKRSYHLTKEVVKWLMHVGSIPRKQIVFDHLK